MSQTHRIAPRPLERRRHQRVKLVLLGRYMLEDQREYPCQSIDMSPGGLAVRAPVQGRVGERVVIYLEQIGRVEGHISRLLDSGFAMACQMTRHKQEKLANQLTWLANRDVLGLSEDRRHERVVPRRAQVVMRIEDGRDYLVHIADLSRSGAAILTALTPPIGAKIVIGRAAGVVTRHFEGGLGVDFNTPLIVPILDEDVQI